MTIGYTEIEYGAAGPNQIKISNCQTLKFEQEPVYDNSGLVLQYTRFTVRVSGYMLADSVANMQITPNKGALAPAYVQTAGSQHVQLRHLLEQPRQEFKMTLGVSGPAPTVLLHAKPIVSATDLLDKTFDCAGGPMPKMLSVEHLVGNTAIKVQWECTVCLVPDCSGGPSGGDVQKEKGVLSNRWSCADDIDENSYLRSRTFVGELKLANPYINPHDLRQIVVPALTPGVRMKSLSFRASEDALSLQYTVTHEEVTVTAPFPATGIRISHKVSHQEYAIEIDETLAITLQGKRDVDKQQLVKVAAGIADGKLRTGQLNNKTFRLIRYEMSDECGSSQNNQVTVMYYVRHITAEADAFPNANAIVGITQRFGRKIDGTMLTNYNNQLSEGNRPGERPAFAGPISIAGAFAAHLQTPCTQDHSVNRGIAGDSLSATQIQNSMGPVPPLPALVEVFSPLPDLPDSTFNASQSDGIYQTYEIDVQTEEKPLIFQAPNSTSLFGGSSQPSGPSSFAPSTSNPLPVSNSPTGPAAGDTSVFIRGGPSQWERIIRIVAKRHTVPPRLSNPQQSFRDSTGVLHVLKSRIELTCEPQKGVDDTLDYIVRAEYRYGLSKAPTRMIFGTPDYAPVQSLGSSLGSDGPYSFALPTIYSSDHPIG